MFGSSPLLRSAVTCCCVKLFRSVELCWSHPMSKMGLVGSSKEWLQMTAIAFACHHSTKMNAMPRVIHALNGGNPCQVHVRLMHYSRAHFADIVNN